MTCSSSVFSESLSVAYVFHEIEWLISLITGTFALLVL